MQAAGAATVLGDFRDASFDYFGQRTKFFTRGGRFMVLTDGPDGSAAEFEVAYTFGVSPLQQYLVAFPGGRFQVLPIAWDSRTAAEGGQRWFHLYPHEKVGAGDQLHWTGPYQNWNMMCARCHSTDLKKGYDPKTNAYHTTFSEINVACEACHGPGSAHVNWARRATPPYESGGDRGLTVSLDSRWAGGWRLETSDAHFPVRDRPASGATLNVCAPCHSRRSELTETSPPASNLEDFYHLASLAPPRYYPDGQQREEVYEWGSFLQSRMHMKGVTCMDCHEPHSLRTRASGNALCARCHSPAIFDTPSHHFHKEGSAGASCTACHMPTQKYMVIHERLDHSIRVPRPDLGPLTGSPDACTMCHTDRKPEWAAAAMDTWYTRRWRERADGKTALASAIGNGAKGAPSLIALARDASAPAIVRATAAEAMTPYLRPEYLPDVMAILSDSDPLVRIAALDLLEPFDAQARLAAGSASLSDPVRGVRIAAARLLADVDPAKLPVGTAKAFLIATGEYESELRFNADWPGSAMNAGTLALRRGELEKAASEFKRAADLDPCFAAAYVNLADLYRQENRDPEGEAILLAGLKHSPDSPDLHHALGLLQTRRGDSTSALRSLADAASLAPANAHYAYVYAIALHSAGNVSESLKVLRAADKKNPFDTEVLSALVSILNEGNDTAQRAESLEYAKRLAEVLKTDSPTRPPPP